MKKRSTPRLILIFCLIFLLAAALGALFIKSRNDARALREALESLSEKIKENPPVTEPPTTSAPRSGYQLLGARVDFNLFYFGDETLYGTGASDVQHSFRLLLKAGLQNTYGLALNGHQANSEQNPSLLSGSNYFKDLLPRGFTYRLALISAGALTEEAGAQQAEGGSYPYSQYGGDFAKDYESLLRLIKFYFPACDILCVIAHNEPADSARAEAIAALSDYYGLVCVDMRPVFETGDSLVDERGFPNDEGHRLYAETIKAAIDAAVQADRPPSALPPTPLYLPQN